MATLAIQERKEATEAKGIKSQDTTVSTKQTSLAAQDENVSLQEATFGKQDVPINNKGNDRMALSQEETNFLRIAILLSLVASRAVREMFDIYNHPSILPRKLNLHKESLRLLYNARVINEHKWDTLYPQQGYATSKDFDLMLMILLLREISGVSLQSEWGQRPQVDDHSQAADLTTIIYYSCMFRNTKTHSVGISTFTEIWEELSQGIVRIGGQSFISQITDLLNTDLHTERNHSLRKFYSELKSYNKYLKTTSGIRDSQNVNVLNTWKETNEVFIPTNATKAVHSSVYKNDVIVMSGSPGCGKSVTMHHVALMLLDDGYSVLSIFSVSEILDLWAFGEKQLFLLNNPFGLQFKDISEVYSWFQCQKNLQKYFQYASMKILMTVSSKILQNEIISDILSGFRYEIINFDDDSFVLTKTERMDIFQKHAFFQNRKDLLGMGTYVQTLKIPCFPLLCKIVTANKHLNSSVFEFFKDPLKAIGKEICHVYATDKLYYFCLLLCLIQDGSFDISDFDCNNKKFNMLRNDLLEICDLPRNTSLIVIKGKLESGKHLFLRKANEYRYIFLHSIIHDTFVNHVNTLSCNVHRLILNYCSVKFLNERIRLSVTENKKYSSCIVLDDELETTWANRILNDIKEGYWHDVFTNLDLKTEKGDQILFMALQKLEPTMVQNIMCNNNLQPRNPVKINIPKHFDSKYFTALHWAVVIGLKHVVFSILRMMSCSPSSSNDKTDYFLSLFLLSCTTGNEEMVKGLIKYAYDISEICVDDVTPLYVSAINGCENVVKVLLDNGAEVNQCNKCGESPLYVSSCYGYEGLVKMLLEEGADVNKCDIDGRSPLFVSTYNGHWKIVKILLEHSADVNKHDGDGYLPLSVAVLNGYTDIVKLLIGSGADMDVCYPDGTSLLCLASSNGQFEICKHLLDGGANLNQSSKHRNSPLYVSSINGHEEIAKLLMDYGADVNACNKDGWSALYVTSLIGNAQILQILIDGGADVNKCNNNDWSPLYVSCYHGHHNVVQILIEHGANLNACNDCDESALYAACSSGHENVVTLLINSGADVNMCNNDGWSALYPSSWFGYDRIVEILIKNGACVDMSSYDGWSPLYLSSWYGHANIVKILLDNGASVNKCNKYGWSPLYVSSCEGHDKVVKLLVDGGANLNMCNNYDWSPLHVSSYNGPENVVELLINAGCDLNMCNDNGMTALYLASGMGHHNIVKMLIDDGADINKQNTLGISCLDIATFYDNCKVERLLEERGAK